MGVRGPARRAPDRPVPHEKIDGAKIESYIAPGNDTAMRRTDRAGHRCHWILEVHLVDRRRQIGGFYEELLDLG